MEVGSSEDVDVVDTAVVRGLLAKDAWVLAAGFRACILQDLGVI